MLEFFKNILHSIRPPKGDNPSEPQVFWRGVFYGLLALSLFVTFLAGYFWRTGLSPFLMGGATMLIGFVGFWVLRFLGAIAHSTLNNLLRYIPTFVFSLILGTIAIFSLAKEMRFGWPANVLNDSIVISMLSFGAFAGSLLVLIKGKGKYKFIHIGLIAMSIVLVFMSVKWLSNEGDDPYPISFEQTAAPLLSSNGIDNPGLPGDFGVSYFTYGNGTDIRREEYANVKYKTETVDATKIITDWKGKKAKWRKRYWGFGNDAFPINGRVWMPEGDGTFPIILVVHGNHGMEHHSDPGYAYLGELWASRGFIAVSVDENFINGTWSGDFRGKEMPARGWLLLKHLEQWKSWSEDASHELYKKADLDNVMLVGHSRGGEAMPIAATYNKLSHFPDDANVEFDFNFGIKGVAAIAPTDMRYFRRLNLKDINYFSLQGSYDSDEASFFGLRQYQRVSYTENSDNFSAGAYVHLANHGQFNSIWGRRDAGYPFGWFLNTGPMMSGEDQRQIAKVYLGAYAEILLHGDASYKSLFKNAAVGKDWFPDELMINNYKDANSDILVDFEEDVDLFTTKVVTNTISSNGLKIWREEPLKFRDSDLQGTKVAMIGWDSVATNASYEVNLNDSRDIESISSVLITMARGEYSELNAKGDESKELNFTIKLVDETGNAVQTDISSIKKVAPRIKVKYSKMEAMNGRYGDKWEATMETFEFPTSAFPGIANMENVKQIQLLFNRTKNGMLIIDNIGFSKR